MKPICLALLSGALTIIAFGFVAPGAAQDKKDDKKAPPAGETKVVKRIWFPRFSPDGTTVLAAHGGWDKKESGEARLYKAKDGEVQHVFPHPRGVRTVAWSAKGTFFVTGAYGDGIRGFDVKECKELFHLATGQSVHNLRITSDDKLLAASVGTGGIRLYDLMTQKEVHRFDVVHEGGIWGMALAPNDNLLATASQDTHVFVLDIGTRKKLHDLKHLGEVNGVAFAPDSRHLATGCQDSRIRIFDVKTGERLALVKGHERGTVTDLQFTSDGKLLASSGADGTVRLWDVSDLKNPSEKAVLKAHTGAAFGVAISPDDRWLVSVGLDEQVKMWDLKTGEVAWTWKRE
jgi:WD40 repeat protein